MKIKKIIVSFFGLVVLLVGNISTTVFAEKSLEEDDQNTSFLVEAIQPDTQVNKDVSYFFFKAKPGEEQTLHTKITNKTDKELTVLVDVTDAGTNYHGNIDYFMTNPMLSTGKETRISNIVTPETKEVVLSPKEEKIVGLKVSPPKKEFAGIRLGGVSFKEKQEKQDGISNTYKYLMSVVMTEDLKPHNENGDLVFDKVGAKLHNGQKVVETTLKNPNPFIIEKLNISTNLTRKEDNKQLAANAYEGVTVAPNSTYELLTYLGLESLKPGKYIIDIHGQNETDEWSWSEEFEILADEAKDLNKNTEYKVSIPRIFIILISVLGIVTISLITYLTVRLKKMQKNQEIEGEVK